MNERLIALEEDASQRRQAGGPLEGRHLLVVGASGYVGGAFARYAAARGAVIQRVSSIECDFEDLAAVTALFDALDASPWTVVFAAVVPKRQTTSFEGFMRNLHLVRHLIEGCRHRPVEGLIYCSSADVYGRRPQLPLTEDSPLKPDSWYALAKVVCEWMLCRAEALSCPVTVLRLPGVFGRAPNDHSVIGQMVEAVREGGRICVSHEHLLRDYVWIDDLCRLLERLIPTRYRGALNVATGRSHSLGEIARLIGRLLGQEVAVARGEPDEARAFDLQFNTARLNAVVPGFTFSNIEQGIRSYQ